MKNGKPKHTRQDAERLFEGLNSSKVSSGSRPGNPFEHGVFKEVERVDEESKLWKDTNHPDWNRLSAWLDARYPQHRDPLRNWEDCEENLGN